MDAMIKNGTAKPLSDAEVKQAQQVRKDAVVKHVGNKKKFNVGRSNNSQSSK
jgi:hypothetical protein